MSVRSWAPRREPRSYTPRPDAEASWRALAGAATQLQRHGDQPGLITALSSARPACLAAPYPIEGEAAAATAGALLTLCQTYSRCPEDHRGWRRETLAALAQEVEALLDQRAASKAAAGRRCSGEGD